MSQKQVSISKKEFVIHPYERRITSTLKLLEKDLSEYNLGTDGSHARTQIGSNRVTSSFVIKIIYPQSIIHLHSFVMLFA